ncbi:zinc ribbon domain-containing protein [Micromonospora polyrhachis]|uniref:zinc ribbon domain-containing protein n=1 Tax=Micromonospora polyrhachis TaxID=1282883 RepID=UPI0035E42D4A
MRTSSSDSFRGCSGLQAGLEYKADWYGRNLVVVDRWFPSSKLCSTCGARAERMPLDVRTWTCRCSRCRSRKTQGRPRESPPVRAVEDVKPGALRASCSRAAGRGR